MCFIPEEMAAVSKRKRKEKGSNPGAEVGSLAPRLSAAGYYFLRTGSGIASNSTFSDLNVLSVIVPATYL